MKKLLLVSLLVFTQGKAFSQPGTYYHLCVKLYDSTLAEIDTASISNDFSLRLVNFKHDRCEGYGFIGDSNDTLIYCLISYMDYCVFKSSIQIVKNQTDTMRVFFRYRSHHVAKRQIYVNNIVFMAGNYIVKSPPELNDWKKANKKRGKIKKIEGSIIKFRHKVFYSRLTALRKSTHYAEK